MSTQSNLHAYFYRVGLMAILLFFLGFLVAVGVIAQSRQSGNTGMDADTLTEVRLNKEAEEL